jgi:ribosome-binding factor A
MAAKADIQRPGENDRARCATDHPLEPAPAQTGVDDDTGGNCVPRRHHGDRDTHEPSQRQLRVGEVVRHTLSELLIRGDVHDPVLQSRLITVPEVRMSPDLRVATIYVMPLGGRDADQVLEALDRNKRFLRGEIAHRVNLKFSPDLRFRVDERFDEAERIEKLLRTPEVQRDLAPDSDDK